MAAQSTARHWATQLFEGLPEDALLEGLRVVSVCSDPSRAPGGYVDVWRTPPELPAPVLGDDDEAQPIEDDGAGLLICSDVCDMEEFEALKQLVRDLCCRQEPPQLLLLLPREPPSEEAKQMHKDHIFALLEEGFDDVVTCQSDPFSLCLDVHAKISATRQRLELGLRTYQRRRASAHLHSKTKHILDFAMWHYLPAKVTRMIPRIARNLHPEPLRNQVAHHTFTKRLGGGFYGQVYAAAASHLVDASELNGAAAAPTEAFKVVDKSGLYGMREIKMLHHMITVHNLLSSPRLQHPNIASLRNVFHSPTHLFFRMEYAGPESLYARLAASTPQPSPSTSAGAGAGSQEGDASGVAGEQGGSRSSGGAGGSKQGKGLPELPHAAAARAAKVRPISTEALRAILEQATAAVSHMHLNAGACHRDLKLENFVVAAGTTAAGAVPRIKLVDFDFARLVAELPAPEQGAVGPPVARHRCHGKCGTVPYVAPEVAFDRSYDGMAADVWSLGVLFLEVLCGVRVMENTFNIEHKAHFSGGEGVEGVAERIRSAFKAPGYAAALLGQKVREEALPITGAGPLIEAMLTLDPARRAGMATVQPMVEQLSCGNLHEQRQKP